MKQKLFHLFTDPIDTENGALANIPNFMIRWVIFMSANAIFQAVADIVIEGLVLLEAVPFKVPFRLEFLLLTLVSTVIAYLTLASLRHGDLDVTRNTMIIGLIVETSLVIGDLYLLAGAGDNFWTLLFVRIGFLILTGSNILIIAMILTRRFKVKRTRPHYKF